MSERSKITAARFDRGVAIRVEGAGTMLESPVMHAFAERILAVPDTEDVVVIDLSACTYVDSTFLGGLVSLFKRHGSARPDRFSIYAPAAIRQTLFGTSRLDRVFSFVEDPPRVAVECLPLEGQSVATREELGHYVVECHRRLAELGGPEGETFGRVADAIANELTTRRRT